MKTKSIKREAIEWAIMIVGGGFIYMMGWHTTIIGKVQQVVLSTGVMQPHEVTDEKYASYDFTLADSEGKHKAFENFKGKTVFINFWATWCPPCVAEMPDIQNLYKKTGDDISFVMVSLDRNEDHARQFVKKNGYSFPVYFLQSRLPDTYDTHSIPTTYVIDKQGKFRIENHGMAKYDSDSFIQLLQEINSE